MNFKSTFIQCTVASSMILGQVALIHAENKPTANQNKYNAMTAAAGAAQAIARKFGIKVNPQEGLTFVQKSRAMYGDITDTKLGVAFSYPTAAFKNLVVFSYLDSSGEITTGTTLVVGDVVGSFRPETSPVIIVEPNQKTAIASLLKKNGFEIYVSESSSFIAIQSSDLLAVAKILAPVAKFIQSVETDGEMSIPEAPQELLPVMIPKNETSLKAIGALTGSIPSELLLNQKTTVTFNAQIEAKNAAAAIATTLGFKVNPEKGVNFVQNTREMYGMIINSKVGVAFAYPTPVFKNLVVFSYVDSAGVVTTGATLAVGDSVGPFEAKAQPIIGVKSTELKKVASALQAKGFETDVSDSGSFISVRSSDFVGLSKALESVATSIEYVELNGTFSIPEAPQELSPVLIPKSVTSIEEVKTLTGDFPTSALFGANSCAKNF